MQERMWLHKEPIAAADWFKQVFPDRHKYLYEDNMYTDRTMKFTEDHLIDQINFYKSKDDRP